MKHRATIIQKVQTSTTGFSLWVLALARISPHRLKPLLLESETPEDGFAS
jgi:hypothetical protein